ncbi:MAG: N-carbamoylputrescine amidohydrolase [marine bacterium B5-7]|nr:MAG: N-carbamoylputrescine amidohydrolase [marine bacterium B5-7]
MSELTVAATQMKCTSDRNENIANAERLIRQAATSGARIILLQELFEGPYFCKDQDPAWFDLARPRADNELIKLMSSLARELEVVLPLSFFEQAGNSYFNSLVVIDADGSDLGLYRKSHIPDGPGYQEKYYFTPGDTGFKVWETRYARIGVGICWDQWFPEAARTMALKGAEILFYPTAIGSEPPAPKWDSSRHWQRVMQGHAAANIVPIVAANRTGAEQGQSCTVTFYGSSFIADATGEIIAEASRDEEAVITASFDLDKINRLRRSWGLFRDRRPDLYTALSRFDGSC